METKYTHSAGSCACRPRTGRAPSAAPPPKFARTAMTSTDAPQRAESPRAAPSALARKIQKVLSIRADSEAMTDALRSLSGVYTENSIAARRSLRSTLERGVISELRAFVDAAQPLVQATEKAHASATELATFCRDVQTRVTEVRERSADVVKRISSLDRERQRLEKRAVSLETVAERFTLSKDERAALHHFPPDEAFFRALDRARTIQTDCEVLLRSRNEALGVDVMEDMASLLEDAYEQVFRWVQSEMAVLDEACDDTELRLSHLRNAVRALQERPVLYQYCVDEVASSRQQSVVRRFIAALTRGGPRGVPRPIEMHAHDPVRYVSDMLAWVHVSAAAERDFAADLFGQSVLRNQHNGEEGPDDDVVRAESDGTGDDAPSGAPSESPAKDEDTGQERLVAGAAIVASRAFDGLCRPLELRLSQVLDSLGDLAICHKVAHLVEFYAETLRGIVPQAASLHATLHRSKTAAASALDRIVQVSAKKIEEYPSACPPDLSPPKIVVETLYRLREIVSSPSITPDSAVSRDVVSQFVEPLLGLCRRCTAGLDGLTAAVLMANCADAIETELRGPRASSEPVAWLGPAEKARDEAISSIIDLHSFRIIQECHMDDIVQRYKRGEQVDRDSAKRAASAFCARALSPGALDAKAVELLESNDVVEGSLEKLGEAYQTVYSALGDDPVGDDILAPEEVARVLEGAR